MWLIRQFIKIFSLVLFLVIPQSLHSFYINEMGDKELLRNDFNPKAAIFAAYSSADVYGDSKIIYQKNLEE